MNSFGKRIEFGKIELRFHGESVCVLINFMKNLKENGEKARKMNERMHMRSRKTRNQSSNTEVPIILL